MKYSHQVNLSIYGKIVIIVSMILSCGILYPLIGSLGNNGNRYLIYDIFLFPSKYLFLLPEWKYNVTKDLHILNSISFISPIVILLSALPISIPIYFYVHGLLLDHDFSKSSVIFWKNSFFIFFCFSVLYFFIWFISPLDLISPYTSNILKNIFWVIIAIIQLPTVIPSFFSSFSFEAGFDTIHGYGDTYIFYKTATAFGVVVWSIIISGIYLLIRKKRIINKLNDQNEVRA